MGGHSGLWCDASSKLVCLYSMPHYAHGCRISTLIMVPINFWRNSDLFKKKIVFLAQKLTKLDHFKENLSSFSKKISEIQNINLWIVGVTMITFATKLNNFGSIWLWNYLHGLECHIPMFQSPVCPPPRSLSVTVSYVLCPSIFCWGNLSTLILDPLEF